VNNLAQPACSCEDAWIPERRDGIPAANSQQHRSRANPFETNAGGAIIARGAFSQRPSSSR